ncbi:MAG: hypothetical protein FWD55_02535, partial [Propionibacteriaceae bacterium]|nr:hypothetical protein [Propionibacteriaceae bacterium]
PALGVERLGSYIPMSSLPKTLNNLPVLGVAEDSLKPIGFRPDGTFIVAGMPGSGRTTALRYLAHALHRWNPRIPKYYIGPSRSVLHTEGIWADSAKTEEEISKLAADIQPVFDLVTGDQPGGILFIESLSEFIGSNVEQAIVALIRAGRRNGHFIIGEAESAGWASAWPIVSEIRNGRRGFILQPDQGDGDLFRVDFPRMKRADYPLGRGIMVDAGKFQVVQLPVPE